LLGSSNLPRRLGMRIKVKTEIREGVEHRP
jgi:hypothetical protein